MIVCPGESVFELGCQGNRDLCFDRNNSNTCSCDKNSAIELGIGPRELSVEGDID